MAYLLISIVFSVSVSILLKMARKKKIDIAQAVAVNYVVAVILTLSVLKPDVGNIGAFLPTWPLFAALGVLLPSVFVIMGKSVESAGIVKSDAAQRLSLFLPIVAALTLFGEKLSEGKLIGLCLAFAALFCLLWKSDSGKNQAARGGRRYCCSVCGRVTALSTSCSNRLPKAARHLRATCWLHLRWRVC